MHVSLLIMHSIFVVQQQFFGLVTNLLELASVFAGGLERAVQLGIARPSGFVPESQPDGCDGFDFPRLQRRRGRPRFNGQLLDLLSTPADSFTFSGFLRRQTGEEFQSDGAAECRAELDPTCVPTFKF